MIVMLLLPTLFCKVKCKMTRTLSSIFNNKTHKIGSFSFKLTNFKVIYRVIFAKMLKFNLEIVMFSQVCTAGDSFWYRFWNFTISVLNFVNRILSHN